MSWFSRKPHTKKLKHPAPKKHFGPIAQQQWDIMKNGSLDKQEKTKQKHKQLST